jgi:hypothetical protein
MNQLAPRALPILPLPRLAETHIYFNIDSISEEHNSYYALGWAFNNEDPTTPLTIHVMDGDREAGVGIATQHRPDVFSLGAPTAEVGFKILLKPTYGTVLTFVSSANGLDSILANASLPKPLIKQMLDRTDVIATFSVLFHRRPENEDAINHQLIYHSTKASLFQALFMSPEFHEKNMDILSILKSSSWRKNA